MTPRVLVVRSGSKPFPPVAGDVELLERVSHAIVPVAPPSGAFALEADLVLFTSQPAVAAVLDDPILAARLGAALSRGSVAAVGEATAAALRQRGVSASIVARGSAASLLDALPRRLEGKRIALPCAEDAAALLPDALRQRGGELERVVVYRKIPAPMDADLGPAIVARPPAAYCATAPSAASWLFAGLPESAAAILREAPAVALGTATLRRLESFGVVRVRVADPPEYGAAARLLGTLATAPAGT
jgi:uroporphyrinogen III methyltransferase / synthase